MKLPIPIIRIITWLLLIYSYVLAAVLIIRYAFHDPKWIEAKYIGIGIVMIIVASIWLVCLITYWNYITRCQREDYKESEEMSVWSGGNVLLTIVGMSNLVLWTLMIALLML